MFVNNLSDCPPIYVGGSDIIGRCPFDVLSSGVGRVLHITGGKILVRPPQAGKPSKGG